MVLNIVLGVLLVVSVIANIFFANVVKKASKVIKHSQLIDDVKTHVLAHLLNFEETMVYVEAIRKAILLISDGEDADIINYEALVKDIKEQVNKEFTLVDLLDKLCKDANVVKEEE